MQDKNLANRLKELRSRKGFSQEALANEAELSLRTVQRIENGETQPTGDTLKRIAKALDVLPEELIDWTIKKDNNYLKKLTLSALTFLIFPLFGIIIPLIMWISKKGQIKGVDKVASNLINFEITWNITLLFFPIIFNLVIYLIKGELSMATIISTTLLFGIVMYIINFLYIITNSLKIDNERKLNFNPQIKFIRN